MKEQRYKTISVRVPLDEADTLQIVAKENGVSLSHMIRATLHLAMILATETTGLSSEQIAELARAQKAKKQ